MRWQTIKVTIWQLRKFQQSAVRSKCVKILTVQVDDVRLRTASSIAGVRSIVTTPQIRATLDDDYGKARGTGRHWTGGIRSFGGRAGQQKTTDPPAVRHLPERLERDTNRDVLACSFFAR
ncbi:hypothetical protein E2P81_ATG11196 [Venturia nashicola]|uniref:Uncharacterized protein n=1 Tax=Venturia nashicola TaxID=86259 RepID=A0A4Z1P2J7_9PEZI|nr:hypothetical protein E6O75_ATG10879 [Venturia nashicola]TLD35077.1 hypothetical protein E2P81_ATG11196 [Venturia nashicola]